jgi:F-type H+-transporting ATPase subunit b
MVTLNLTLFIEVGLFLLFLAAMNRYVLRPLLGVMDARETQVQTDRETAVKASEEAVRLERDYRAHLAAAHRQASIQLGRAHREAQEVHTQKVNELRRVEVEQLKAARAEAREQVHAQREHYDRLVDELYLHAVHELRLEGVMKGERV